MANVTPTPPSSTASAQKAAALPPDLLAEVATNAYIYTYPLIIMELTRRVGTNVPGLDQFSKAPMIRLQSSGVSRR